MALSHAAVVMKAGSAKKTPESSLRHSSADTPPLTMGISTDSPVRLSVMVMESGTAPPRTDAASLPRDYWPGRTAKTPRSVELVAVHVGLPKGEAQALVEPVGCLPR